MKLQTYWIISTFLFLFYYTSSIAQPTEDVRYLTLDHAESHQNGFYDLDSDGDMDIISVNRDYAELSLVWFEKVEAYFIG